MRLIFAVAVAALTLVPGGVAAQQERPTLDLAAHMPVTIQLRNAPLSEALQMLAEIGFIEIRLDQDVDGTRPVTVRFILAKYEEALALLLESQKLRYTAPDPKTVVVMTRPGVPQSSVGAPAANRQPMIRLQFEIYRSGSLVSTLRFLVPDSVPKTVTIDNVGTLPVTAVRMDAERIAVTIDIATGGQKVNPQLVLAIRGREPGVLSWTPASGETVQLRVVSP